MAPLSALDFQLVLLRRMADFQPGLVEDAQRTLGVTRARMREANRRWNALTHTRRRPPHAAFLGPPETTSRQRVGDLVTECRSWPLPLWPDLRFHLLLAPDGTPWHETLSRAPGSGAPALRTLADLTPWSCTLDEAAAAFPRARPLEGSAPTRWRLALTAPDTAGRPRAVTAEFTYGLLQRCSVTTQT